MKDQKVRNYGRGGTGTIREAEQQRYTYDQGLPDGKDPENELKNQMPCVVSSEHAEPGLV